MSELKGRCWVLYPFEVGRQISLRRCREVLQDTRHLPHVRKRPAPSLFGLSESPLIWLTSSAEVDVGKRPMRVERRAVIYDFGCISVSFDVELRGDLAAWRDTAIEVAEPESLDALARTTLDELLGKIEDAIEHPERCERLVHYAVYQLDGVPGNDTARWLENNEMTVAQLLRSDDCMLSEDQVRESLARRVSYAVDDLVIIDYATALVVDNESDDTLAVLDFVNIELISLQILDEDLDVALDSASRLLRSAHYRIGSLLRPYGKPIRQLVELTTDAAAEFEAVDNAIKLTEDHYLGRVYRLAADRFHLAAFDNDITRKLQTLWNIHTVHLERSASRRSELLEWIIIILIAVEVLAYLR